MRPRRVDVSWRDRLTLMLPSGNIQVLPIGNMKCGCCPWITGTCIMISRFRSISTAALAVVVALHSVIPVHAQPVSSALGVTESPTVARVPFGVGEELVFHATFGKLPAGTARMRVDGIDTVRGHAAYHVTFAIDGGILFFRVHDSFESWIDVESHSS